MRSDQDVPAGGRRADSGAADAPRIDPSDRDAIGNISSQNDVPGVGTRAGDGTMEPRGRPGEAEPSVRDQAPVLSSRRSRRAGGTRASDTMRGGRGVWWLVPAGLLGAVCIGLLLASASFVGFIAWAGIALQLVLFGALVFVALTRPLGPERSLLFASLLGAMAVSAVGLMLTVYAIAASR